MATKTLSDGSKYTGFTFDSTDLFARAAKPDRLSESDESWYGESLASAYRNATGNGRQDLVSKGEKLLTKISANVETLHSTWERSVAGAYPCVPDALMGVPDPMRRRVQMSSERAPLKIVIDLVSSAVITADQLLQRGITYLALGMALSQERAVEVWGFVAMGVPGKSAAGCQFLICRSGEPLNLSVAANALTSMGLVRGMGYAYCRRHNGGSGDWAFAGHPRPGEGAAKYSKLAREALALDAGDLFVAPTYMGDPAVTDPVRFINDTLAAFADREA